jgi:hypothetical protein
VFCESQASVVVDWGTSRQLATYGIKEVDAGLANQVGSGKEHDDDVAGSQDQGNGSDKSCQK